MPTQRRMRHLSPASLMTQMWKNAAAGLPSRDVDELKQSLIDVWHGFEQSVISVRNYETLSI